MKLTHLLLAIAFVAVLGGGIIHALKDAPEMNEATDSEKTAKSVSPENETRGIPIRSISLADGFDFPVGPPDAKKYYNAQGFQENNHLGEDWNGVGGGNTDKGDPVYSVAAGVVIIAEDYGAGWGNVVRILHNIGTEEKPEIIESLYAHLDKMLVSPEKTVKRGQQIGTIGDAHGAYWAHLHLEMRWKTGMEVGGGYSTDTTGFLIPTKFIKSHRRINN